MDDAFYQQQQQIPQQQPSGQFPPNYATPSAFPSSQKNPPFDALGLGSTSTSTRERYQHHQRNLSLPQPSSTVSFDYKYPPPQQQQQQPPQPPQQQLQQQHQLQHVSPPQPVPPHQPQSQFRPSHSHHASLSSIPYFTSSTHSTYPSSQRVYPYQQQQQHTLPNNVGSTSVHQIIQFHHWQPNQQSQKSSASTSPKKENATLAASVEDQQSAKRRKSSISTDQPLSPTPSIGTKAQTPPLSTSTSSTAIASALARRKSTHSRNKSETTGLRSDILKMSLCSTESSPPKAATSGSTVADRNSTGFNFLASVAAEESRKMKDPEEKLSPEFKYPPPGTVTPSERDDDEHMADAGSVSHQEHQRSHKQNVNFMISDKS